VSTVWALGELRFVGTADLEKGAVELTHSKWERISRETAAAYGANFASATTPV
jgi:hypothetical protein